MSTTRTVLADEAQSYPLSALNDQPIVKGSESSIEQQQPGSEVVDRQPATPVLKLLVAGYSFFCAGVSDGTREYYSEPSISCHARSQELDGLLSTTFDVRTAL